MSARRWIGAAALVLSGAACTNVLGLDDYRAPGAGACVSEGCLGCMVRGCDASTVHGQLGSDPLAGDFSGAACPAYAECLCACTDTACADACGTKVAATCGGVLGTITVSCTAAALCPCTQ